MEDPVQRRLWCMIVETYWKVRWEQFFDIFPMHLFASQLLLFSKGLKKDTAMHNGRLNNEKGDESKSKR